MKKSLLVLALWALVGGLAQGQITSFPYVLDFENGLDGWTTVDADQDGQNWTVESFAGSHSGSHVATSWSYNAVADLALYPNNWLISPAIVLGDDTATFSWWSRVQSIWAAEHYAVYVSTTGGEVSDFTGLTPLFEVTMSYDGYYNWKRDSILLGAYTNETVYIAIRHFNCQNMHNLIIDDLAIEAGGGCGPVTDLTVSDVTSTSATVSWTMDVDAATVEVYVNGTAMGATGDTSMLLEDLEPATNYTVVVVSLCLGGGTSDMAVTQFSTLCEAVEEFPHEEDFEGGVGCWSFNANDWEQQMSTVWSNSGSHYMYSEYGGLLVSPEFVVPDDGEEYVATFMARPYSTTFYSMTAHFKVYVSTEGLTVFDSATFVEIFDTMLTTAGYSMIVASLEGYEGQTVRVAIMNSANQLFIDDFALRTQTLPEVVIEGPAITDLGIAATFRAVLEEGSAQGLTFTWSSTMATAGNAVMLPADSLLTITYQALGTDTITVAVHNDYGDDTASMTVTVRNLNQVTVMPYTTGFETTQDTNWVFENSVNGWRFGTNAKSEGERGLYICYQNSNYDVDSIGVDSNYYNTFQTTARSYAYRALQMEPGEYALLFDWRCMGEEACDYLRAFLVPSSVQLTANVANGVTATTAPEGWIALDGGALSGSAEWQTAEASVYIPELSVYQLVFYWRNDGNLGEQPPAAVDNVYVGMVTCFRPIDLTMDNATSDSLSFHWTPTSDEEQWEVRVTSGTWSVESIVNNPSMALGGLEANTQYTVRVRAICGAGDSSLWVTQTMRTECVDIELPYIETFASTEGFLCWTLIDADGNGATWGANHYNDGDYMLAPYSSTGLDDWAIMPPVTLPVDADGYKLIWDVRGGFYDIDAHYEVRVSPTAGSTTPSFTDVVFTETYGDIVFVRRSVSLDAYAGQTIRIAFRHINTGDDNGLTIDNIEIRETNIPVIEMTGPTDAVIGEEVSYIATLIEGNTNGLTYTWRSVLETVSSTTTYMAHTYSTTGVDTISVIAANSYGADTAFVVVTVMDTTLEPFCYAPEMDQPTSTLNTVAISFTSDAPSFEVAIMEGEWNEPTTVETITAQSHTFQGLQPNTQYTVGVRAVCDATHTSVWIHRSVTTANDAGIDSRELEAGSVSVHPNPTSGKVVVRVESREWKMEVLDLSGRVVMSEQVVGREELTVDVSELEGAHFVRVTTADGTAVRKLIIIKS